MVFLGAIDRSGEAAAGAPGPDRPPARDADERADTRWCLLLHRPDYRSRIKIGIVSEAALHTRYGRRELLELEGVRIDSWGLLEVCAGRVAPTLHDDADKRAQAPGG